MLHATDRKNRKIQRMAGILPVNEETNRLRKQQFVFCFRILPVTRLMKYGD